jgi:hypothetical protein
MALTQLTISGHRRIMLRCPGCNQMFWLGQGEFKARSRASIGHKLCCSPACSQVHRQEQRKVERQARLAAMGSA